MVLYCKSYNKFQWWAAINKTKDFLTGQFHQRPKTTKFLHLRSLLCAGDPILALSPPSEITALMRVDVLGAELGAIDTGGGALDLLILTHIWRWCG